MSIVADQGAVQVGVAEEVSQAAEWMRVRVGEMGAGGRASTGELLPRQEVEDGAPRLEVRFSLGLTPEELLGAAWDAFGLWEEITEAGSVEAVPAERVRWWVMTSVVILGGTDGPGMAGAVDAAYREGAGMPREHQLARAAVHAAFGVWPRPALAVAR